MPKVSVIMPAYNVETTIAASIQSVLNQTFCDFELIVVNDECNDETMQVVGEINDPRIKIVSQKNRGLAGARNTGIWHAQGEYLAFLDSDDLWRKDKLEQHVRHLNMDPLIDVSYSASEMIDDDGNSLGLFMSPRLKNITPDHVMTRNPIGNGSVPVIRRSVFEDIAFYAPGLGRRVCYFDESFRQSEDIECWTRIAVQTRAKFEGLADPLTLYRINAGGLSANIEKQYESWKRFIAKTKEYAPEFVAKHANRAMAYQLRYFARRATRMDDRATALSYFLTAFKAYPLMLVEEPKKTISTAASSVFIRLFGAGLYQRLENMLLTAMKERAAS